MADNGRRVIDQNIATRNTIANADSLLLDSNANGTRQITYEEFVEAIKLALNYATLVNTVSGAMQKATYDANNNGIVDNAEKVNNHTVGCDVPADAVFTDHIYDDTEVRNLIGQKLNITDYVNFVGATSEDPGTAGRVPAPQLMGQYLSSEGAWQSPDTVPTTDSTKLITSGGVKTALDNFRITVDSAMSESSENPVQNKIITGKMKSTAKADNSYHMGFYIDSDGDLCQA